jgi:hypothetical protein
MAIDTVDAPWAGGGFVFDLLRFAVFGVVFADIAFPGDGGSGRFGLTLTLSLSRFFPDLQPPSHALARESLMGLVNQS